MDDLFFKLLLIIYVGDNDFLLISKLFYFILLL